jgi:UDP-N-acetylglucosamine transferase subunit ALG13
MPIQHGSKFYCQLLIDPHRYKLAEKLAELRDVKVTALLRDLVYEGLENAFTASEYGAAVANDEAAWRDAIKRRVDGRMRSRAKQDP